ncbi:hypothetical protein WQO_00005 [Streptomyces globisporus C-1027]|uniref:Uncharacterized protein n=1 Tax=Streptomyces globisporus C-1027 TaxID=1172567 RepID=A0A0U3L7N2_STRGL|nr:hypothetical protein WQO_00005 [Streptomyces globisporus C-1027]
MSDNNRSNRAPQQEKPSQESTQEPEEGPRRLAASARWGVRSLKVMGYLMTIGRIIEFIADNL